MQRPRNWHEATDQLSGLPVIANGRSYHDFDNDFAIVLDRLVKPGDIILFRCISDARNAVVYTQRILGYPAEACLFNHAALYVGNGKICEATPIDGVCIRSIFASAAGREVCILRPPRVSDEDRKDVALWALSKIGMPYDYHACYRLISGSMKYLSPKSGAYLKDDLKPFFVPADAVLRKLDKKPKNNHDWDIDKQIIGGEPIQEDLIHEEDLVQRFICSNLVVRAYFNVLGRDSPMIMQIEDYTIPIAPPAEIYINPNLQTVSPVSHVEPARIYRFTPR